MTRDKDGQRARVRKEAHLVDRRNDSIHHLALYPASVSGDKQKGNKQKGNKGLQPKHKANRTLNGFHTMARYLTTNSALPRPVMILPLPMSRSPDSTTHMM